MSIHVYAVHQPQKQLGQLLAWLDKAEAHATERGFEPNLLLDYRLAPDMFPLRRQIQATCDAAKFIAARAAGVEAPTHADEETTLAQLRVRVQAVIDYLGSFDPSAFDGHDARVITLPFLPPSKGLTVQSYVVELGLPNFGFHLTSCYAILRHAGVALGKRDYLGQISLFDL